MGDQVTIFDFVPAAYGDKGCKVCQWNRDGRCFWAIIKDRPGKPSVDFTFPECDGGCSFMPNEYKIPRMCANCKHSNQFVYETKPEYEKDLEKHNGYTDKAANDPVEEPDIYCTHHDGSLNRRTEYKDFESAGFGIGHWHRQHEWDTCDRWELETSGYVDYRELKMAMKGENNDIRNNGKRN